MLNQILEQVKKKIDNLSDKEKFFRDIILDKLSIDEMIKKVYELRTRYQDRIIILQDNNLDDIKLCNLLLRAMNNNFEKVKCRYDKNLGVEAYIYENKEFKLISYQGPEKKYMSIHKR